MENVTTENAVPVSDVSLSSRDVERGRKLLIRCCFWVAASLGAKLCEARSTGYGTGTFEVASCGAGIHIPSPSHRYLYPCVLLHDVPSFEGP